MKYVIFFGVLIVGVPMGCVVASGNKKFENFIFFLAMFFTCRLSETINFISRENYRGTSRGFEITLVDLATLIIIFLVIKRKDIYKITALPPGSFLYFLFFLFSALSITNSGIALYGFFELWKIIRMYIYYWAFYNYLNEPEQLNIMMYFVGIIIIYIFMVVLQQKYLEGRFQCPGPFPHQNSMVMYLIVFGSIMFAALMNKIETKKIDFYFFLGTFGMASICIISSLSRAGLALYALSIFNIFMLSYFNGINAKKIGVTILFIAMGAAILYKAMDSIVERFETAPEESANTRVELANAAAAMADDHKLGAGLNNFSLKMVEPYRYYLYRNKGAWEEGGIVETAYLLIAAETGWHNLVIFLLFILQFYFRNLGNYFRYKGIDHRYITIGLIGGLLSIYLETALEWVLKQTGNSYQLMLVFALIAAMKKIVKSGAYDEEDNKEEEILYLDPDEDFDEEKYEVIDEIIIDDEELEYQDKKFAQLAENYN